MSQQQRRSGQAPDEAKEKQDQERAARGTFGDRAATARTADDPRAQAPHDRAGMPSTGDEEL